MIPVPYPQGKVVGRVQDPSGGAGDSAQGARAGCTRVPTNRQGDLFFKSVPAMRRQDLAAGRDRRSEVKQLKVIEKIIG